MNSPVPFAPPASDHSYTVPNPGPSAPLAYTPAAEFQEEDEDQTTAELLETLRGISEKVAADEGRAFRSVHAKAHGILHGHIDIPALPPVLAQGLFARPGRRPVVMRLSSTPGDLLDDTVSTPRGLAIKVGDVDGMPLDAADGSRSQDFLMVNGPVFSAPTARKFLRSLKLLAATTDKAPAAKALLSAALRGLETVVEKAGGESATLKALGGHPATHPLGDTYFTQVPLLYGSYMAKLSLAPASPGLLALNGAPVDLQAGPNALRDAVAAHCAQAGGVWELRAQLCVDLDRMPIEDASVEWPQDLAPFVTVARITVPPQAAWDDATSPAEDNALAFSPLRGLADHRPLGSIMRVRRRAYAMAVQFRQAYNAAAADPGAAQKFGVVASP